MIIQRPRHSQNYFLYLKIFRQRRLSALGGDQPLAEKVERI